ncbi:uncharacterized protein LOC117330459 [Pecten maximus]|uniref:uncharacterized protein LOC117330459 n=1 Tax=Pecten maximus TaxID=6579 RepID=UPI0014588F12|nr:uncharacterized protein LOC117330459 [Pecten maximus]
MERRHIHILCLVGLIALLVTDANAAKHSLSVKHHPDGHSGAESSISLATGKIFHIVRRGIDGGILYTLFATWHADTSYLEKCLTHSKLQLCLVRQQQALQDSPSNNTIML